MTDLLTRPEETKAAQTVTKNGSGDHRVLLTRAMYHALGDNGFLPERYELIEGVIYNKMPVNPPHRMVLMLVRNWLLMLFGLEFVQTENPIVLTGEDGNTTEPEPDIAVTLRPTTAYVTANPGPADIVLLIEISDTTLDRDLTTKARIYARAGVPEYWAFDITGRELHRHRQPTPDGYGETVILKADQTITAPGREESIRINELLPPEPATSEAAGS